jgi:hypothetical protein
MMWSEAAASPEAGRAEALRAELQAIAAAAAGGDDCEIEYEMLAGLDALVELAASTSREGPPRIATGHRAVGADACHFSAPASLPDDPAQPSGTLLLTSARLVFVGGARSLTIPWHAVARCLHEERDVVLVRSDREDLYRLRCNSFADALCAAFLVRRLACRHV